MTRRGGRLARTMLRVGLLVGGMITVWAGHELATADTAYAAEPAPVAPVEATVDLLTDVLTPVRDALAPGSPEPVRRGASATVVPPGRAPRTSPPAPPGATPHPPPARPAPPEARTPSTRPAVTPPRARVARPVPADPAPVRDPVAADRVLTPVTETLRPITGPVTDDVLTPVADALRPITEPVRDDVLTPIGAVLRPVTEVLDPVLAPVENTLDPVLGVLDPVLNPLDPVTEQAAPPPASTPVAPVPSDGPVATTAPLPSADSVAASTLAAEPRSRASALTEPVRPGRSRSLGAPDAPPWLLVPTPDHSGAGTPGGGHGEFADLTAGDWAPATRSTHRRAPRADAVRPTRSPRPGTRPA